MAFISFPTSSIVKKNKISTVVIDQNKDAIAKAYADLFLDIDTSNAYKVIEAIEQNCQQEGIAGVLVAGVELARAGEQVFRNTSILSLLI